MEIWSSQSRQLQPSLPLEAVLWSVGNCGVRVTGAPRSHRGILARSASRALGASGWHGHSGRSQADCQPFAHPLVVFRALPPCVPLAESVPTKAFPGPTPVPRRITAGCQSPCFCRVMGGQRCCHRFPLSCVLPATLSLLPPTSSPCGCLRAGGGDRKRWNHLHCDCTCPPTLRLKLPQVGHLAYACL